MSLQSFVEIPLNSDFPLENLPFGIFKPRQGSARVGVALGDYVVDLSVLESKGHLSFGGKATGVFSRDTLNAFLALGRPAWQQTRKTLQQLLGANTPTLRDDGPLRDQVFHRPQDVTMRLPAHIGDYTDF